MNIRWACRCQAADVKAEEQGFAGRRREGIVYVMADRTTIDDCVRLGVERLSKIVWPFYCKKTGEQLRDTIFDVELVPGSTEYYFVSLRVPTLWLKAIMTAIN